MTHEPKRRRILINPRFQLKASVVLMLVGVVTAGLFTVVLALSLAIQNHLLEEGMQADEMLKKESQDVLILLLNMPDQNEEQKDAYSERFEDLRSRYDKSKQDKAFMLGRNQTTLWAALGFVGLLGIGLFFWGLLLTHRVAGPMYVIQQQIQRLAGEGNCPPRQLRKGDALADVYSSISDDIQRIEKRING